MALSKSTMTSMVPNPVIIFLFFILFNLSAKFDIIFMPFQKNSLPSVSFSFFINLFIYLFLAALGLRCCMQALPSCCERRLLFIVVGGLLTEVDVHVTERGL